MKSVFGVRKASLVGVAAVAAFTLAGPLRMMAQVTAVLHGKVSNAAGQPLTKGEVKLSTDRTSPPADRKYPFDFPLDASGNYKGDKVSPGDYIAVVFLDGKSIDFQDVVLKPGDDKTLDFDMTRKEYMDKMTPEERAALEENKKHNAGVLAENAKIADINKTLIQARADEKAGKADDAVAALKPLTAAKPDEMVIWAALGEAELDSADASIKAARAAHQPSSSPEIAQKFTDSIAAYQKAIDLNASAKKPSPEIVAGAYLNMGHADVMVGKVPDGIAAYDSAVKAMPTIAAMAYTNEAATLFNTEKKDEAAVAADKAIAADPKKADLYYIKGASLIGKTQVDSKTNKMVPPAGCVEAYQEYLELDPTGVHAAEVKDLLTNLGQPIKNSYKAGKK